MSDVMSRFESLGDNCEFGLVQRQYGHEESSALRWAYSRSVACLVRLLDARFEGLFEPENLVPGYAIMVEDTAFGMQFHSALRTVHNGTDWVCSADRTEQLAVLAQEREKLRHLIRRTIEHLEQASRIFVYKSNAGTSDHEAATLLRSLRRYGDNRLLVVTANAGRNGPTVERVGPHLLHGRISRFSEYLIVDSDIRVEEWGTVCRSALDLVDGPARPVRPIPAHETLFEGSRYRVRFNRVSHDKFVVVVFDTADLEPTFSRPFWGEDFFRRRGINAIGITPCRNDWYVQPEIEDALRAILRATPGMERVGYGASMGGFGVINHAEALGLARLVAVAPQFSPDPQKTPFETRFAQLYSDMTFPLDRLAAQSKRATGYVVFDPLTQDDSRHVALIGQHHDLHHVLVPLSVHAPLQVLQEVGLLEDALLTMLRGALSVAALRQDVRQRRRLSATYLTQLAYALLRRGRQLAALDMLERARAVADPPNFDIDSTYARVLAANGRRPDAVRALDRWLDDPSHGAAALDLQQSIAAAEAQAAAEAAARRPQLLGFVAGTHIRTAAGDVAVEALVEGELIATTDGALLPLRWLGKRRFDASAPAAASRTVCIRRGALGENLPMRDLWLGRDHALMLDGRPVPAGMLVDGAAVVAAAAPTPTLFHPELSTDAPIFAENVPVLVRLPAGDRAGFANAATWTP